MTEVLVQNWFGVKAVFVSLITWQRIGGETEWEMCGWVGGGGGNTVMKAGNRQKLA
jgi:hypothetical protein